MMGPQKKSNLFSFFSYYSTAENDLYPLLSLQVWPMLCWQLFLQSLVYTPPSTQFSSTLFLAHPNTSQLVCVWSFAVSLHWAIFKGAKWSAIMHHLPEMFSLCHINVLLMLWSCRKPYLLQKQNKHFVLFPWLFFWAASAVAIMKEYLVSLIFSLDSFSHSFEK